MWPGRLSLFDFSSGMTLCTHRILVFLGPGVWETLVPGIDPESAWVCISTSFPSWLMPTILWHRHSPSSLGHVMCAQAGLSCCAVLHVTWMWVLKGPWDIPIAWWPLPYVRLRIPRGKGPKGMRGECGGPFTDWLALFFFSTLPSTFPSASLWFPPALLFLNLSETQFPHLWNRDRKT